MTLGQQPDEPTNMPSFLSTPNKTNGALSLPLMESSRRRQADREGHGGTTCKRPDGLHDKAHMSPLGGVPTPSPSLTAAPTSPQPLTTVPYRYSGPGEAHLGLADRSPPRQPIPGIRSRTPTHWVDRREGARNPPTPPPVLRRPIPPPTCTVSPRPACPPLHPDRLSPNGPFPLPHFTKLLLPPAGKRRCPRQLAM